MANWERKLVCLTLIFTGEMMDSGRKDQVKCEKNEEI